MKALFSYVNWGRVLLTGVLVVILVVILNTVLLLLTTRVWGQPDQAQLTIQISSWITYILLLLLTFGGAVWVARKVEREAPLHGLLLGLVVALILYSFRRRRRIMQKGQKTYTPEFKREAVLLVQTSGKPIAQVARELGISDTSIQKFRKEVRHLKRALEIVKQERELSSALAARRHAIEYEPYCRLLR